MIEVRAQLRNLRMSPKKVRLVANTIRGLDAHDALVRLQFVQKASSPLIAKLLKSAMANAMHNKNLAADSLFVKRIIVNEAKALHRWKPAAFGAAHPFKRRGSHIDLVLGLKVGAKEPRKARSEKKSAMPAAVQGGAPAKARATEQKSAPRDGRPQLKDSVRQRSKPAYQSRKK